MVPQHRMPESLVMRPCQFCDYCGLPTAHELHTPGEYGRHGLVVCEKCLSIGQEDMGAFIRKNKLYFLSVATLQAQACDGSQVTVRRSNGTLEPDWTVVHDAQLAFNEADEIFLTVCKRTDKLGPGVDQYNKMVRLSEFCTLNHLDATAIREACLQLPF